jgi:1-phosphofructokinase
VGEETVGLFERLNEGTDAKYSLYKVPGATRLNITIRDSFSKRVSHIRTRGTEIGDETVEDFYAGVLREVQKGDWVVASGSLPPGVSDHFYRMLIERLREKGAHVVFDSSGQPLLEGLKGRPFMIKPNLVELSQVLGSPVENTAAELAGIVRSDVFEGVEMVVVSRGRDGVVAFSRSTKVLLEARLADGVAVRVPNSVGAGDALVGGIVAGLAGGLSFSEAITRGVACGASKLFESAPGGADRGLLSDLLRDVVVNEV